MRRSKNTVTFTKDMPLRMNKETFLVNDGKKQRFTILLKELLMSMELKWKMMPMY